MAIGFEYYIIIGIISLVSWLVSNTLKRKFKKYSQVELRNGMSGAEIAEKIRHIIDEATDAWGIDVQSVELKDAILPEDMKRTIAKQAEAEREKRAVIIKAEGEVMAAENMARAAQTLSEQTGALHLRSLQTLNDLSSDQSNTVIFAVPLEVLRAFENIADQGKK